LRRKTKDNLAYVYILVIVGLCVELACKRKDERSKRSRLLESQSLLGRVVEHKNHGGTDGTESVRDESLVERTNTFVGNDASEAVSGSLVEALFRGLLGLHLEATADGIKGISGGGGAKDSGLGGGKCGDHAHDAKVILVGVQADDGVESAELDATICDDTHDRDAESVVQGEETSLLDGLGDAIAEAVEITLAGADIGGETGTGVIQGVDDGQGGGTSGTTGGEIGTEKLPEFGLGVVLGEQLLDLVLEGQVEGLGGEVTDDVGSVAAPERAHALLGLDTSEGVANAGVARDLTGSDLRVGILGLDNELDALDGSSCGLGDRAGRTAEQEIHHEIRLVRHGWKRR